MGAKCLPIYANDGRSAKVRRVASSSIKNRVRSRRKVQSLRVPPGKIIKAQAMLVEGHSQREVGRTLHMSAHTVAKVVKTENFLDHIKQMQERLFAIAPDALASFHAQVKMDGHLAYAFLKDLQIIPTREALAQFVNAATASSETGYERQARLIAAVLLEGREHLGLDLGPQIEEALAKDVEESAEATATPARSASLSAGVK